MKKILTLVAVVATAGLIMAWGCGGKAVMGSGEEYLENGSVPFVATTSGGTSAPEALGLTKDIDTSGSGAPFGQVNSEGESASVMCEFEWDDATNDGGGIVTPVMTITAEKTPDEMKAICTAAMYSPLNCIGCINEYLWSDDPLADPIEYETRDATLYCAGNVPNHYTSDLKYIKARLICHPLLSAGDVDVEHTWVIETFESKAPWLEINTVANLLGVDIIGNTDQNNPALGSFFDLTYNTGNPAHPTLVTAPLDAGSIIDAYDPMASSRKGTLFLDITTRGTDTPVVFDFDRTIETPLSLSGVTGGATILQRGRLFLGWSLCDNRDIGCAPITSWSSFSMVGLTRSWAGPTIYEGASDIDVSGAGVEIDGVGGASFYADSIGAYTMMSGYSNVFFSPVTMLTLEPEMPYEVVANLSPLDGSIFVPLSSKGDEYAYFYGNRELQLTYNAGILGSIAGAKFATNAPFSITSFWTAPAASDYFDVDPLEIVVATQKLRFHAYKLVSFTNNPIWATVIPYVDIKAMVNDGVLSHYVDAGLYTNNALVFSSVAASTNGIIVRLDKDKVTLAGAGAMIDAKLNSISGFANDGDRFIIRAAEHDNSPTLYFGLKAQKDATTVKSTGDIDFVLNNVATPNVNSNVCLPVTFDGSTITTHVEMMDAVAASIEACGDGLLATADVTNVREITSVGVGGLELAISIAVTANPALTFAHVNAGPVRLDCYMYPKVGGGGLSSHACDAQAAITLSFVSSVDGNNVSHNYFYYKIGNNAPVKVGEFDSVDFVDDIALSLIFLAQDKFTSFKLDELVLTGLDVEGQMSGPPIPSQAW